MCGSLGSELPRTPYTRTSENSYSTSFMNKGKRKGQSLKMPRPVLRLPATP